MSSLSTLPKGDSAWLLRKAVERIMQQVSVLETNIGSSTTGNSANTQIIFNDAGTLRGDPDLTFSTALNKLVANNIETVAALQVGGAATITGNLTVSGAANFNGGALAGYLNGNLLFGSSGNTVNFYSQSSGFAFKDNTGANNLLTISTAGVFGFLDGAGGTRMTLNSTGLGIGGSPVNPLTVFAAASAKAPALLLSTVGSPTYGWDFSVDGAVNGNLFIRRMDASVKTDVMEFDRGNGNIIMTPSTTAASLTVNGQLTFNATSNTNLRFSYRGSDGVTRTANLTLA